LYRIFYFLKLFKVQFEKEGVFLLSYLWKQSLTLCSNKKMIVLDETFVSLLLFSQLTYQFGVDERNFLLRNLPVVRRNF
jgi:hypothetical protein